MDHLVRPNHPKHPLVKVPFICRPSHRFDGKEWTTFPARMGFDKELLRRGGESKIGEPTHLLEEVHSLLQSWLFYGVLAEVFSYVKDVQSLLEDFIVSDHEVGQVRVATGYLPFHFDELHEYLRCESGTCVEKHIRRIADCLEEAFVFTATSPYFLGTILGEPDEAFLAQSVLDDRIGASIYILHRSIKDAVEALQWQWWWDGRSAEGQIVKQMDVTWHSRARPNAFAEKRLLDDGCCPTDLHWMSGSGHMLHFASELDWKLRKSFNHRECKHSCRAIDVDNSTYATKHVRDDCQCNFAATPPIEDAISIIEKGGVPVVIMKMNDLGEIEALKFASVGPDSQYVAFSHVWAHGLGNATGNTLPVCQLQKLHRMANGVLDPILTVLEDEQVQISHHGPRDRKRETRRFRRQQGPRRCEEDEPMFFWIDTLCIPCMDLRARSAAIISMKEVYSKARAIVVIDDMFQHVIDESMTRTEMFARFRLSDWGRRLWTLQEAVLARDLYIALSTHFWRPGYFTDHDEGRLPTLHGYEPEPTYETTAEGFHGRWLQIARSHMVQHKKGRTSAVGWDLNFSLAGRLYEMLLNFAGSSTSRKDYEFICHGGLLGLDLAAVAASDGIERATHFWTKVGAVPTYVIFADVPRLPNEPCRWAPATFLETFQSGNLLESRRQDTRYPDLKIEVPCDDEGLHFESPGVMVNAGRGASFHRYLFEQNCTLGDKLFFVDYLSDTENKARKANMSVAEFQDEWKFELAALILEQPLPIRGIELQETPQWYAGLLVSAVEKHGDVIHARYEAMVRLCEMKREVWWPEAVVTRLLDSTRGKVPCMVAFDAMEKAQKWCIR